MLGHKLVTMIWFNSSHSVYAIGKIASIMQYTFSYGLIHCDLFHGLIDQYGIPYMVVHVAQLYILLFEKYHYTMESHNKSGNVFPITRTGNILKVMLPGSL